MCRIPSSKGTSVILVCCDFPNTIAAEVPTVWLLSSDKVPTPRSDFFAHAGQVLFPDSNIEFIVTVVYQAVLVPACKAAPRRSKGIQRPRQCGNFLQGCLNSTSQFGEGSLYLKLEYFVAILTATHEPASSIGWRRVKGTRQFCYFDSSATSSLILMDGCQN